MNAPGFATLDTVRYGVTEPVAPGIRRVIADNPSKFTYRGTGTYIVGTGDVAVIDPGPDLDSHRRALERALSAERVVAIAVTHCHADHSPLAAWLHDVTGAPRLAFGAHPAPDEPHGDGDGDRDDATDDAVDDAVDWAFRPDLLVADGETAARGPGWSLVGVHTPGHTSNHLCFACPEQRVLFTGDHVMGWSTTVVSPPDGDMAAYLRSLRKVQGRDDAAYWPTHGPAVAEPQRYVAELIEHRLARERAVLRCVRDGMAHIDDIVALLYADVRAELHGAAARTVLAHLVKLVDEGQVAVVDGGRPSVASRFAAG